MFPFQIFTTLVHECWHALVAAFLGGSSIKIIISKDGSGLTSYRLPPGKLRQALVTSAGYLGSSVTGCSILLLTLFTVRSPTTWNLNKMAITFSILIGFTLIFWIRNVFGWISTICLGVGIYSLSSLPMKPYAFELFLFLGIQTSQNALFDIQNLFRLGAKKHQTSDAHIMQKIYYLPHWFWAISWLLLSILFMYWTARYAHIF